MRPVMTRMFFAALALCGVAWAAAPAAYAADEIEVHGQPRTFVLHVPTGFESGTGAPLVIAFHGQGGTAWACRY